MDNKIYEEVVSAANVIPVRKEKVHKKKAAKLLLLENLINSNENIYGLPKKLLVLDMNKVLIFRRNRFGGNYDIRPHTLHFLREISSR